MHLSAYDEGGVYRAKQIAMLNEILKTERDNGNYVIAGGDFNHDIADSSTYFKTTQKIIKSPLSRGLQYAILTN